MEAQNAGSWKIVDLKISPFIKAVRKLTQIVKINFFRTGNERESCSSLGSVQEKKIGSLEQQVFLNPSSSVLALNISTAHTVKPESWQSLEGEEMRLDFHSQKIVII